MKFRKLRWMGFYGAASLAGTFADLVVLPGTASRFPFVRFGHGGQGGEMNSDPYPPIFTRNGRAIYTPLRCLVSPIPPEHTRSHCETSISQIRFR